MQPGDKFVDTSPRQFDLRDVLKHPLGLHIHTRSWMPKDFFLVYSDDTDDLRLDSPSPPDDGLPFADLQRAAAELYGLTKPDYPAVARCVLGDEVCKVLPEEMLENAGRAVIARAMPFPSPQAPTKEQLTAMLPELRQIAARAAFPTRRLL